jgi:hypothetical protein
MEMYRQGFMGVLYFRSVGDLERGLWGANFALKETGWSYDLQAWIVRSEAPNSIAEQPMFVIDAEMNGSAVMFWDFVAALRRLALFSPSGEISCWMNLNDRRQVRAVVGRWDQDTSRA